MNNQAARVLAFEKPKKKSNRKKGINNGKQGSVRNINGTAYVDFRYLDNRVQESSGLKFTKRNENIVRKQLNSIINSIEEGSFKYAEVFPKSKKKDKFTKLESEAFDLLETPEYLEFEKVALDWYDLKKNSGRITERTLLDYKSQLYNYLIPYFGKMKFVQLNSSTFEKFISWAKNQHFRGKTISNATINKLFIPLKMICKHVAIEYGWGRAYDPFFGFKKLVEEDSIREIKPFTIEEQHMLINMLSEHWKPYFVFAFCSGLRPGEQLALKSKDIDWNTRILNIERALTLDLNGKNTIGKTKNIYSRRKIKLTEPMYHALLEQKKIYDKFKGEFFFCSINGEMIDRSNLSDRVWRIVLEKVGLEFRSIKQTRHSFATLALSCGESPLWIARVMGHRDANMIIKVYTRYVENMVNKDDGTEISSLYKTIISN